MAFKWSIFHINATLEKSSNSKLSYSPLRTCEVLNILLKLALSIKHGRVPPRKGLTEIRMRSVSGYLKDLCSDEDVDSELSIFLISAKTCNRLKSAVEALTGKCNELDH